MSQVMTAVDRIAVAISYSFESLLYSHFRLWSLDLNYCTSTPVDTTIVR
jgi:hypothetical protein